MQSPGRLRARIGQDLAVLTAAAVSVVLSFLLAAAASAVAATGLALSAPPQSRSSRSPRPGAAVAFALS